MKKTLLTLLVMNLLAIFLVAGPTDQAEERITLQQALSEALARNDLLRKSQSEVESAMASVEEAKGSFLPTVSANFDYNYLDIVPGFKSQILGNIRHDLFPRLAVNQLIFTGGRLKYARENALTVLEATRLGLKEDEINIKIGVTTQYYRLISLGQLAKILEENRRQLETAYQYSRLLVQAGRISELELSRLEVELANLDSQILKARNDYLVACNDLGVLMGRDSSTVFIPREELKVEPLPLAEEELVKTALENNPRWARIQKEIQSLEYRVRLQKSAQMPQVSATVWYGYEFGLQSFSFKRNDRIFVGLSAQVPVFTGGTIKARIVSAELQLQQARIQQEYLRKTLEGQVKNLYLRVKEMEKRVEVQQKAVEQAEKSLRLAFIEYQAGRRSNTDLLDIQKSLLNASLQLNQIVVDYNLSQAQLYYVLGIL